MSAELSARRTVAAAVLADFKRETDAYIDSSGAVPKPDMAAWAFRLASELRSVLQRLEAEDREPGPAAQLAEVRHVLADFEPGVDSVQHALEQIDDIVNRSQS